MASLALPVHPGEILREEFMAPLGLSANALARALHVIPAHINDIVRERRGITADTGVPAAEAGQGQPEVVGEAEAEGRQPEDRHGLEEPSSGMAAQGPLGQP